MNGEVPDEEAGFSDAAVADDDELDGNRVL
jgi:hypothetical protein